ncbi:hypothetical protein TNCT_355461 [Trichonephila clavata]|uniref:Uncharacterized protein n=1 Tax=Trichonephila clavata TaxID=2740835 RepID=A0A8X6F5R1_TRICU|nr:hypothetical protein TNCT_355461 [Trichonephila clavata]
MSLSRSHYGGCSATYDTPSSKNVVCRRLYAHSHHSSARRQARRSRTLGVYGGSRRSRACEGATFARSRSPTAAEGEHRGARAAVRREGHTMISSPFSGRLPT